MLGTRWPFYNLQLHRFIKHNQEFPLHLHVVPDDEVDHKQELLQVITSFEGDLVRSPLQLIHLHSEQSLQAGHVSMFQIVIKFLERCKDTTWTDTTWKERNLENHNLNRIEPELTQLTTCT